ncbi:hypothetical protein ACQ4PT_043068 [Festuca glaucescens]
MDVLHRMFERAASDGLLTELAASGFQHRTSMYADDVVTFVHPTEVDLRACALIVEDFGVASGLRTNLAKCSIHPIRCQPEQVELARDILGCEVASFPFKYLGLPLGLRKVTAAQLQPLVDSAASRLPPWCANLLTRGGRTILVQTTLCAIPIHAMMSLDIPPKILDALRKICRAFLWKGRLEVKGGHCLVAWGKVASPKDLGGLGVPNLRLLNLALRCRWAWLKKVDPSRPWADFDIQLPSLCTAIFESATAYVLGNGERARFWKDRWLGGETVVDIAPNVDVFSKKKTSNPVNANHTQRAPAAPAFYEPDEPRDFVPGAADVWVGEPEELGIRIRQRYVQGLQVILQQLLQVLVERHRAGALICGVAGTIWVRWVAASKVFGEMWARKVMAEARTRLRRD